MYHVADLIFNTPQLEEAFRQLIASDQEMGGFMVLNYFDPPFIRWNTWKKYFDEHAPARIVDWLLMPNQSKTPNQSFFNAHYEAAHDMMDLTRRSRPRDRYGEVVFFHSHPIGSKNNMSRQDIAFALTNCVQMEFYDHAISGMIICQSGPLRVNYYHLSYRSGRDLDIQKGNFISWRERRLKDVKALIQT